MVSTRYRSSISNNSIVNKRSWRWWTKSIGFALPSLCYLMENHDNHNWTRVYQIICRNSHQCVLRTLTKYYCKISSHSSVLNHLVLDSHIYEDFTSKNMQRLYQDRWVLKKWLCVWKITCCRIDQTPTVVKYTTRHNKYIYQKDGLYLKQNSHFEISNQQGIRTMNVFVYWNLFLRILWVLCDFDQDTLINEVLSFDYYLHCDSPLYDAPSKKSWILGSNQRHRWRTWTDHYIVYFVWFSDHILFVDCHYPTLIDITLATFKDTPTSNKHDGLYAARRMTRELPMNSGSFLTNAIRDNPVSSGTSVWIDKNQYYAYHIE